MNYNREECLIALKKAFQHMLEYFNIIDIEVPNISIVDTGEDEIIYPDRSKRNVFVQSEFLSQTHLSFALLVFVHECIHIYIHDLPKARDARYVKDCFGTAVMDMFDIDADVSSFLIGKQLCSNPLSVEQYIDFVYRAQESFPMTKQHQACRFIGSLISVFLSDAFDKKIIAYPEIVPFEGEANIILRIEGALFFFKSANLSGFDAKIVPPRESFMLTGLHQFVDRHLSS